MSNQVLLSVDYIPNPSIGKALSLADIYVGIVDLDPKIVGNRKQISVLQENGTTVQVTQPISTSAGGVPLYNGSPVTILVDGSYSLRIDNSSGVQQYYVPKNAELEALSSFDSIADMRAITDTPSDGDVYNVLGYYASTESQDWSFQWNASSTAADNSGTIIKATSITTGRWIRLGEDGSFLHFGAYPDNTNPTITTTAIQAALDVYPVIHDYGGNYAIDSTVTWNESRIIGAKGFATSFLWYGVAGGTMFNVTTGFQLIAFEHVYFNGRNVAGLLVGLKGTTTLKSPNFQRCIFGGATVQAVLIGDFTNAGTDPDVAPAMFDGCIFYDCVIGITIDSLNVLLISAQDCIFQSLTPGVVATSVFVKRGGSFKAYNCYFEGQPVLGDTWAIDVIDGWVNLTDCEFEWGQGGGGGGILRLQAPTVTSAPLNSRGEHVSTLNGCRVLSFGETGTGHIVTVESALPSLTISSSFFNGKVGLSTPTIDNAFGAQIVSMNNKYTGRPFPPQASTLNITSINDSVYDGTDTYYLPMMARKTKTLSVSSTPYQVTQNDEVLYISGGAIPITLPPAVGITTGLYQPSGKIIEISQSGVSTSNTLIPSGADTINGSATALTLNQYSSIILESDGASDWSIVSYYKETSDGTVSTGVGSIKMVTANPATNDGWHEIAPGVYVPTFTNIRP